MLSLCILAFCFSAVLVESSHLNQKTLSTLFPHKSIPFEDFSKLYDAGNFKRNKIEILTKNMIDISELVRGMQWLETISPDKKGFEIFAEKLGIEPTELE